MERGICMQSLFLKILLSSFLTVIFVGIGLALEFAVMIPSADGFKLAPSFLPILAVGISGLICFLLTRHITSPLFELRRGAETIAAGNLSARVPVSLRERRDEIGSSAVISIAWRSALSHWSTVTSDCLAMHPTNCVRPCRGYSSHWD